MFLTTTSIQSLWPIAILLGLSVLIPIVLSLLHFKRTPSLVVEIIVGVGIAFLVVNIPYLRNMFIVANDEGEISLSMFPESLYVVGMSILLFLSGLDTDFSVFKRFTKNEYEAKSPLIFAIMFFVGVIILSFGISFFFRPFIHSHVWFSQVLITLFLSSTFASLVVPVVHDFKLAKTTIGKIMTTYATISELTSIIGLSVCMLVLDFSFIKLISIAILFAIFGIVFVVQKFVPTERLFGSKLEGIVHLSFRFLIFVILLLIIVSDLCGVEYIFGAFLAGMLFKATNPGKKTFEYAEAIGYGIFVPIFYMLLGFKVSLFVMNDYTIVFSWQSLLIFGMLIAAILLTRTPFLYLFKYYPAKTTLPTMFLSMTTIIVAVAIEHMSEGAGLLNESLVLMMIIVSLISCIVPPIIFGNGDDFGEAREKYKDVILEKSDYINQKEHH